MNHYCFVDLDNTLIYASTAYGAPSKHQVVVEFACGEKYHAILRPGAIDLLKKLREKYGEVYMLTAATQDYASKMSETFGLGFVKGTIYAREDTEHYVVEKLNFPVGKCVLIDDLPDVSWQHHIHRKKSFLSAVGPVRVINVRAFNGYMNQELSEDAQNNLMTQIEGFFNE